MYSYNGKGRAFLAFTMKEDADPKVKQRLVSRIGRTIGGKLSFSNGMYFGVAIEHESARASESRRKLRSLMDLHEKNSDIFPVFVCSGNLNPPELTFLTDIGNYARRWA